MTDRQHGKAFRDFMEKHRDDVLTDGLRQAEARALADRAMQSGDRAAAYEALRMADAYGVLRPGFRADNPDYAAYVAEREATGDKFRSVRAMQNYMAQGARPEDAAWEADAARHADETLEAVDEMMASCGGFEAVFLGVPDDVPETVDTDEVRDLVEIRDAAYASILAAEDMGAPMGDLWERYPDYGGWANMMRELEEQAGAGEPEITEETGFAGFGDLFGADVTRKPDPGPALEAMAEKHRTRNGPSVGQEAAVDRAHEDQGAQSSAEDTTQPNRGRPNRRHLGPGFDVGGIGGDERQFN